jgi:hypothetical protein
MGIAGWESGWTWLEAAGTRLDVAWTWLDTPGLDGGRRYPVTSDSGLIQSGDKSPHSKFGSDLSVLWFSMWLSSAWELPGGKAAGTWMFWTLAENFVTLKS